MSDPISGAIPPHAVTVVIPTIPPRASKLTEAVRSAAFQSKPPDAFSISVDVHRRGAAWNRTRACEAVRTEWIAFLDDDDLLYPDHLLRLCQTQEETGADVVYPWCDVKGGFDPFPQFEGLPWDREAPHLFPITTLIRTEVAREVGFFLRPGVHTGDPWNDAEGGFSGEDWPFWLAVNEIATIHHLPERTWAWNHWGGNTSGRPDRW